jgi:hypothetical protein
MIPKPCVSDVLTKPRFNRAADSRQHVSHQSFLASDRFEILVNMANLRVEPASCKIPKPLNIHAKLPVKKDYRTPHTAVIK